MKSKIFISLLIVQLIGLATAVSSVPDIREPDMNVLNVSYDKLSNEDHTKLTIEAGAIRRSIRNANYTIKVLMITSVISFLLAGFGLIARAKETVRAQ